MSNFELGPVSPRGAEIWMSLKRWAEGKGITVTATRALTAKESAGRWLVTYSIPETGCEVVVQDESACLSIETETAVLHELEDRYNKLAELVEGA